MEKVYHINGTVMADVDEDTFNQEFLEWVVSKGWTFAGFTMPEEDNDEKEKPERD